jgi:AcrR family transcriptional regulator
MAVTSTSAPTPGSTLPAGDTARRIMAATAECVAAQGLRATSVEDIAERAGCARATIYRLFPGGRSGLLLAAVELQLTEVLDAATRSADAADDLPSAVAGAVWAASTTIADHAPLQRLLHDEPGEILPYISFDRLAPLLGRAAAWGRDHLGRFLDPDQAEAVGEWGARVVLDHLRSPGSPTDTTDLTAVRRLVERYLLPGLTLSTSNPDQEH